MPAALVLPGAQGTIWRGVMPLADGHRAIWSFSPLRSLLGLAVGLDWRVEGADTQMTGGALLSPSGVRIDGAEGLADAALLFAYLPQLPFECRFLGKVDIAAARFGDRRAEVDGSMRNGAGQCRVRGAGSARTDVAVPASRLEAMRAPDGGTTIRLTTGEGGRDTGLLDATLGADGRFSYRLTPQGERLLPFAAQPVAVVPR